MKMKIKSIASVVFLFIKNKVVTEFKKKTSCQIGLRELVQRSRYQFASNLRFLYTPACGFLGGLVLILAYTQIFGLRKLQIGTISTVLDLVDWITKNKQRMVACTVHDKRIKKHGFQDWIFAKGRKSSEYSATSRELYFTVSLV